MLCAFPFSVGGLLTVAVLELDEVFLRDERIDYLASVSGEVKFTARGRILGLWYDCIIKTQTIRTAEEIDLLCGWFNPERGFYADLLVAAKLAEKTDGGYRIRGVGDRMKWLVELKGARRGAALKGVATRKKMVADGVITRNERGQFNPINTPETPKQMHGDVHTGTKQIQTNPCFPVPVPLPVPEKKELKATSQAKRPPNPDVGNFVGAYVKVFQGRYGDKTRPDLSGKVQGQIKRFLVDHPVERAINLIQVYFQIDDKWFETKHHDFTTFIENLNKIGVALDTGQRPGGINWDKVFGEESA